MTDIFDKISQELSNAVAARDEKKIKALERYFEAAPQSDAFGPSLRLSAKQAGKQAAAMAESDVVVGIANSISRAGRWLKYQNMLNGYEGPVIVSEGDSWFQYPIKLYDVIDNVSDRYATRSLGGGGHLLADMFQEDEYADAIREERPHIFLLSGGGNDMVHDENLANFLHPYRPGMDTQAIIDRAAYDRFLRRMQDIYEAIFEKVLNIDGDVAIMCHGYDHAVPVPGGSWLGRPMQTRNVPKGQWPKVIARMIDEFNLMLKTAAGGFPGRVFHIDCRGVVQSSGKGWHDELHPNDPGYKLAADRFIEQIQAVARGRGFPARPTRVDFGDMEDMFGETHRPLDTIIDFGGRDPGRPDEALIGAGIPPDRPPAVGASADEDQGGGGGQHPCSSLVAWRAVLSAEDRAAYRDYQELLDEWDLPDTPARLAARREMASGFDVNALERVLGKSNIYEASYLEKGQRAARAVGRISIINEYGVSRGFGTGFLVGDRVLLTNNHVLDRASRARNSFVIFDYEYDADANLKHTQRFDLDPSLFFTSAELDFTFVGVAPTSRHGVNLSDYGSLPLISESGKAIKKEFVAIIQHGRGHPKQIAIRESQILGRKRHYIYYTTDTNPGSSGSPVLNDDWIPVALHHRTVPDMAKPCAYVANRGIRISSIHDHVRAAATAGDASAGRVLAVFRGLQDDSTLTAPTVVSDGAAGPERTNPEPWHDTDYHTRTGYDEMFLGIRAPMPVVRDARIAAPMRGSGEHVIPYEHFSLVMHAKRRLAIVAASNMDTSEAAKRPDPSRKYTRRALGGFSANDRGEGWFEDPRLLAKYQLPDRFYNKDRKAFDKGHVVRRDAVTFGADYDQVRRANGDTYHSTNCSPQVAGFNRSMAPHFGIWGILENAVAKQAKSEKLCVFAGPVLHRGDPWFEGHDNQGRVNIQIPRAYWKVVVGVDYGKLEAYGFYLEQELDDVDFDVEELYFGRRWRTQLRSLSELEGAVGLIKFHADLHAADQVNGAAAEAILEATGATRF